MSVTYIHYGADKFDKDKFKPIKNRYLWNKPLGGLWASRVNDPLGWYQWSIDNEFDEEALNHSFTFTLKPTANIVTIEKPKDVYALPGWLDKDFGKGIFYPDFEECVRQGIDAIEITDIYGVDNEGENSVYTTLYNWDVNSILILNPDIVEVEE